LAYFQTISDCSFCRYTQDSGVFVLVRNDIVLQMLLLYTGIRGNWLTSKRPWIADFVAIDGSPGHLAYFETTLDCRCCRCMQMLLLIYGIPGQLAYLETTLDCRHCRYRWESGAFGLLRNDLGLQIVSLYIGGQLAYFDTTLDCRSVRCIWESGLFGLLRNDLGL
jgi:hypothetical protein